MPFQLFQKIRNTIEQVVGGGRGVDEELYEELEASLIQADINVQTTQRLIGALRRAVEEEGIRSIQQAVEALKREMVAILEVGDPSTMGLKEASLPPTLYLVVGVNGVGKTTTIAKIAHMLQSRGKRVILAAGDTFRAAAIDQLAEWAQRTGTDLVRHREGADPSAVIYDAIRAARARSVDYVIADTAGRLHTRSNLMEELRKIHRVAERELERVPDEVLLVLDATTGQNAISQAKLFMKYIPITGIVLTKLDGTARGGIVLSIADDLKLPIKLVGTGERLEALEEFNARRFVDRLLEV
ncbi:signal recognition particle-docking protein FtsY [Chthonomonas calidirosea]|uniref:Signal recognition particle receptor FtsY n=1 Tax=Chthonomonas calidirosea (strain DSM 23976 / ICMP 18418 / T49) TaxID=1303518 RepID=S0ESL4_CHTCT|nr:signal recognition particle-docking protein FtsY [Chthonomonas calidirosea]CCW34244.1 signal recognition particle-docking protein FtsY [Chthonomonas calidirosea T49]CEK15338.1 signal recognition particle-docking protein FtsY [Chthonomonas calidirosea]